MKTVIVTGDTGFIGSAVIRHLIANGDYRVMEQGSVGETYNIGGHNEKQSIEVVKTLCRLLDDKAERQPDGVERFEELISFVEDRPGLAVRA